MGEIFACLRRAGLKLQPAKCRLCQQAVAYLGHIVSPVGIATDPEKTERVTTWLAPVSKRDVQQFLGLTNYYRRFIQNYAHIAKPLNRLTEKTATFKWTEQCQQAFDLLKHKLTSAPVLAHPYYSLSFILDTDASDVGIGAVLSQRHPDGKEHVIAYHSRALTKSERRYSVTRREFLAVVTFCRQFRPYLLGRHFTLRTDHGSLQWLHNFKEPDGQLARWITTLQEFDVTVIHRQGRSHANVDTLSRHPSCNSHTTQTLQSAMDPDTDDSAVIAPVSLLGDITPITPEAQRGDKVIGPAFAAVRDGMRLDTHAIAEICTETRQLLQQWDLLTLKHGKLWRRGEKEGHPTVLQLVVPSTFRESVLRELHDTPTGGHLGEEKMLSRVRSRYYWPGFARDVRDYCATCATCASRKSGGPQRRAPLHPFQVESPMHTVAVDILGPLPQTPQGNR